MGQAERLKLVINSLLESPHSFAKGIGLPTAATIYDILSGKRQISPSVLKKILETYPNLNKEWLTDGKGEMFTWKEISPKVEEPQEKYKDDKEMIIEELKKIITQQRELIDNLLKEKG